MPLASRDNISISTDKTIHLSLSYHPRYQSVEQESRQKYKARMERQYRIVKPDASPEEIRQAVDSDDGGQIFSQAVRSCFLLQGRSLAQSLTLPF
jgi:t-SNARE complex subunit (syntaxin)